MAAYTAGGHPMPHGLAQPDQMNHDVSYDGQPPKRRGPKPDSKPALTRRQELNRQAQRTHRERKEMYIKALEQEVLRLKEMFAQSERERNAFAEENRRLKELLMQHGISYDFAASPIKFTRENSGYGASSSGSISGSYRGASESTGFSPPPPPTMTGQMPMAQGMRNMQAGTVRGMGQLPSNRLDYDSIGIDFVLTLERPCMDHMQYLMVRSYNPDGKEFNHPMENPDDTEHEHMSGHALMATAAPYSHVMHKPTEKYPHQMPADLDNPTLIKLLDLSNRLPLDHQGEITPVMAWKLIYLNERVRDLSKFDFERMKTNLATKVRCYGFGAVLEEFEVCDALNGILAEKDGQMMPALDQKMAAQQISVH
ncbi:AP-1-like transcription factor [Pseudocercospora fuligena]|uniref:AP-1-like transcription factor n=1 Tax=Pseudocercospora fuligena TaxID=685502 RepID=A0A8H6RSI8_9PEZI|nr:AP-1-like transcription factor [Pseudocercospora fuligena]